MVILIIIKNVRIDNWRDLKEIICNQKIKYLKNKLKKEFHPHFLIDINISIYKKISILKNEALILLINFN